MATKKTTKKRTVPAPIKDRAVKQTDNEPFASKEAPPLADQVVKRIVGKQPCIIDGKFRRPGETIYLPEPVAYTHGMWLIDPDAQD